MVVLGNGHSFVTINISTSSECLAFHLMRLKNLQIPTYKSNSIASMLGRIFILSALESLTLKLVLFLLSRSVM